MEEDRILLVLPLFHIYGMNVGMNAALRIGATIVLIPRFEAGPVLDQIQKHRCTLLLGAPPMYVAWVNYPQLTDYDLSSLRIAGSGAAALPVQILDAFRERTGAEITEGYGLTEASPVSHTNAVGPFNKPGTIGLAIPGVDTRLVDENDNDVPPGAEGEILLRGVIAQVPVRALIGVDLRSAREIVQAAEVTAIRAPPGNHPGVHGDVFGAGTVQYNGCL